MPLLDEHQVVLPIPPPRPGLVGPCETDPEVELRVIEKEVRRGLEQLLAVEPVVVVAEGGDAVRPRLLHLPLHGRELRLVIVSIARYPGLLMAGVERRGTAHVGPVGEAIAPPKIVLRDPVQLRKVVRD